MGKMSLTSCRALSTPGKFSNVDRYVPQVQLPRVTSVNPALVILLIQLEIS